jgi:hypothetical protein
MNSTQEALVVHIETKVTPPFETADDEFVGTNRTADIKTRRNTSETLTLVIDKHS